ncbi:MAG: hypothetical protein EOM25_09760 [Deltaproteobacteria bacterium]|nr:hypothetical protein [Deltaproteobacteria bacterium]
MKDADQALQDVLEVFQFEYWLRFYFLLEEGGDFFIRLDEKTIERMALEYPHLVEFARRLNETHLTPEISRKLVGEHLFKHYEGQRYKPGLTESVLDGREFNQEMYLFNMWANLHERQLDEHLFPFERWETMFNEWKASESGAKVLDAARMQGASGQSGRS